MRTKFLVLAFGIMFNAKAAIFFILETFALYYWFTHRYSTIFKQISFFFLQRLISGEKTAMINLVCFVAIFVLNSSWVNGKQFATSMPITLSCKFKTTLEA